MDYQTIKFTVEDRVATITLNRPDALNAISPPVVEEVTGAVGRVVDMDQVKALVVRGEGRAFCAGADLTYLDVVFNDPPALGSYLGEFNKMLFSLEELPIPVIAVVHGFALAGGLELLLACDLVIAAEDARIGDQHINFALMPGGGSTQRLTRKLGQQRAMEMLFTGRWLSGREAAQVDLVLRAVPSGSLDAELEGLLKTLRDKSRPALGWIKGSAMRGLELDLREGVALETRSFVEYVSTSDHPAQGITAFKAKTQPKF